MFYVDRTNYQVDQLVIDELETDEKLSKCPNLKEALMLLFRANCAYCGRSVVYSYDAEIDHFIPKNPKNGDPSKERAWDNLVLSCDTCNGKTCKHINVPVLNPCDEIESCCSSVNSKLDYNHIEGLFMLKVGVDNELKEKFNKSNKFINGIISTSGINTLKETRIEKSNCINKYLRILQKFLNISSDEWTKFDDTVRLNFVDRLSFNSDYLRFSHKEIISIYRTKIRSLIQKDGEYCDFVALKIHRIDYFIHTFSSKNELFIQTLQSIREEVLR